MTTPEFPLVDPEEVIKTQIAIDNMLDSKQDAMWRWEGKLVGTNDGKALCPRDQAINVCATTRTMTTVLLQNSLNVETDEETKQEVKYIVADTKHTAKTSCSDCGFACQVSTRIYENTTQEKLRFMFEEPSKETDKDNQSNSEDQNQDYQVRGCIDGRPSSMPIATSFDKPYFEGQ